MLSLVDALAKMTILPARRLEKQDPALAARRAGVQRGADADLASSIRRPSPTARPWRTRSSTRRGIEWVLLGGQVVKDPNGPDRPRSSTGNPSRVGPELDRAVGRSP